MGSRKKSYVQLVRKSNDLVEAKYKFDVWETRVFTKTLTMINKDDEDFKNYRIYLSDLVKDFGLENNKESYEWLKRGARGLMSKIITIIREENGIQMEFETPITIGVDKPLEYHAADELKFIDLSFHPKMKPLLLKLAGRFTTYDVRNILRLPSTYSIRMYELLKQYEKIKRRKIDLNELKEMVGVIEKIDTKKGFEYKDHYPLYGNFRQRVLLQAQKDLKNFTDISFEFEPVKKGRKVNEIIFYISKNTPVREIDKRKSKENNASVKEVYEKIFPIIKDWKDINEISVKKLIRKYGKERVFAACSQTREDAELGKIRQSKGLYFYSLVHNAPTLFDEREEKDHKRKIAGQKAKKKADEIRAIQNSIDVLRQKYSEEKEKFYSTIKKKDKNALIDALEELKQDRNRSKLFQTIKDTESQLKSASIMAQANRILREKYPDEYKPLEKITNSIAELEKQKINL